MGVERDDYIVLGVNVGYDTYDDEYPEVYDKHAGKNQEGDFTFIIDQMSGQYFVVGEVIKYADEWEGFPVVEITLENQKERIDRVKQFIMDSLELSIYPFEEPKLIVVSHFH